MKEYGSSSAAATVPGLLWCGYSHLSSYVGYLFFILQVDIDLTQEGNAKKVSRQQAQLALHADGRFLLTNIGRRTLLVNGNQVVQHHSIHLEHLSVIDLAGIRLLFVVNHLAVHRLVARSQNLVL